MDTKELAQGIVGLLVIGFAVHCYCNTKAPDPAAARAETADRDARRAKLVQGICNAEGDRAASPIVYRFGDAAEETDGMGVVYVRRAQWDALTIDGKLGLAAWAGACKRKKDKLSIRDGNSGETLKHWTLDSGLL